MKKMKLFYKSLLFLFFFFLNSFVLAENNDFMDVVSIKKASQVLIFKNLYVFSAEAQNDVLLGNMFHAAIMEKMTAWKRFKIYDLSLIAEELLKTGLPNIDISTKEKIIRMADSLDIDGFIEPEIKRSESGTKLIIKFLDKKGDLFAIEERDGFTYKSKTALMILFPGNWRI